MKFHEGIFSSFPFDQHCLVALNFLYSAALLHLLLPLEPSWEPLRPHLRTLTTFAVGVRYPGESADKDMAREALTICRDMRRHIRVSLGLEP